MSFNVPTDVLDNAYYIKPRGSSWSDRPTYFFDNANVVLNSPSGVFSSDIIGNELPIDKFSFTVRFDATERQLYYAVGSPREAYVCAGYVPGTLEDTIPAPQYIPEPGEWWRRRSGIPEVAGNEVDFPSSRASQLEIHFPEQFAGSHVVRVGIDVVECSDRICVGVDWANSLIPWQIANCESETGLFTIGGNNNWAYATEPGHDVLTFTPYEDNHADMIVIGGFYHSYDTIPSGKVRITGIEYDGQMLYGTLSANADEGDQPPMLYVLRPKYDADKFLADLAFGDPVYWTVEGNVFAKGYVSEIERTGRYAWKITCVSGVGLLDNKVSVGGIYTGQAFASVFADIVGDTIAYDIADDVASVKVYGWLPYDSARSNLHRLLFALGVALSRHNISADNNDIDYDVAFPGKRIKQVSNDHVALGGSVKLNIPADGVEVTEHAFTALGTDEEVQLYDNTLPEIAEADHLTVVFSEPMHNVASETLTIDESGVNYAIISGRGILTGQRYTHTETVYQLGNPSGSIVKRIISNGLITFANSLNVARRILNYFQSAKAIKAKMILNGDNDTQDAERPGDTIQMTDGWGESVNAYLSKQEVKVSSVCGASCELIGGYVPTDGGNNYQRYKFYTRTTANKTFVVPNGVTSVRIILIQGGAGGQGGENGHNGMGGDPGDPEYGTVDEDGRLRAVTVEIENSFGVTIGYGWQRCYKDTQRGMPGGESGEPGQGGKILIINKEVQNADIITFTQIGAGGAGGNPRANGETGGAGSAGTHTTVSCSRNGSVVWTATSDDGAVNENGYFEAFSNQMFGLPGENGTNGGVGGQTSYDSLTHALHASSGIRGGNVNNWAGGQGGKGVSHFSGMRGMWSGGEYGALNDVACGGGGGGAAYGANGEPGKDAKAVQDPESGGIVYQSYVIGGCGGKGADALPPSQPIYGQGGTGGNGGGAGGNSGGGTAYRDVNNHGWTIYTGHPSGYNGEPFGGGLGGAGSVGGTGGDGIGIIYY